MLDWMFRQDLNAVVENLNTMLNRRSGGTDNSSAPYIHIPYNKVRAVFVCVCLL